MATSSWVLVSVFSSLISTASPYDVDVGVHGALTGGLLLYATFADGLIPESIHQDPTCLLKDGAGHCDPEELNALDRSVVGNNSEDWRLASEVLGGLAIGLPLALDAIDSWTSDSTSPGRDWAQDVLVIAESVALTTAITGIAKWAVRRPRPTQYSEATADRFGWPEHQRSFPSGHTSMVAALTTSYAVTFGLRHPESPWRWVVYTGAAVMTGLTAYARVGGGMHFYTDVMAGAALGATMGIVVPLLHRKAPGLSVGVGNATIAARRVPVVALNGAF